MLQIFNNYDWSKWKCSSMSLLLLGVTILALSFDSLICKGSVLLSSSINLGSISVQLSILSDFQSMSFCGVVLIISGSVYFYSLSYMDGEKYFNRFMGLVSMFILSMVVLIFSNNMIQLILGWDGLGLSSYLLVCYYNNSNSSNAGGLTLMTNRLGDVGLFLMIFSVLQSSHQVLSNMSNSLLLGMLVFFVCCTKSAQVPFCAWLPAAMAAPTPVSSLVHSSTLVTAGVYLMIRFYESLTKILSGCLMVGCITMLMASGVAMVERDMKKIVALSTLSHLGVMTTILSFGWKDLAFSHLVFHAFFKGLLFLVVGYWIHSCAGYQDLTKASLLSFKEPSVSVFGGVSSLSLCGLPYLTGFYSKDVFLEVGVQFGSSLLSLFIMLVSCLGSILYSIRMFLMVNKSGMTPSSFNWDGMSKYYIISMLMLCVMSVLVGSFWLNYWVMEESVLYVFWEVKCIIFLMIIFMGLLGFILSKMSLNSTFLVEMMYLSKVSRSLPNQFNKLLMMNSVKNDNSFLNLYYKNYTMINVSAQMSSLVKQSYFEMILMMVSLCFFLVLLIIS